ncbi:MAG: hypothetical protein R8G34_02545 [Paracoccaceae bacterium]|nr:hypothetical protein [Paracoccaceae bacterium]
MCEGARPFLSNGLDHEVPVAKLLERNELDDSQIRTGEEFIRDQHCYDLMHGVATKVRDPWRSSQHIGDRRGMDLNNGQVCLQADGTTTQLTTTSSDVSAAV